MFKYYLYKAALFLSRKFSRKTSYKIAKLFSGLIYWCSPRDRQFVKNNLQLVLGNKKDVSREVREVFDNFGKYLVEFFRMEEMVNKEFVENHVRVQNRHYLDQALEKGHGGILLTAHLGNWELGAVLFSFLGYPLSVVALPHKERPVNDLFNHQREFFEIEIIPTNVAIRRVFERLKENKLVAIAADRDFQQNGQMVRIFGKDVLLPKGAAMFSMKTKAAIIPSFLIRAQDNTFDLILEEPIYPQEVNTQKENVVPLMQKYVAVLEEKIKTSPTQWMLFREFGAQ